MSGRLATAVTIHVEEGESRLLHAGYEPTVEEAALITNPACWVDGVPPVVDVATPVAASVDTSGSVLPDSSWSKAEIEAWVKSSGLDLPAGLKKDDLLIAIEAWAEDKDSEGMENAAADSDSVGDPK